MMKRFGPLWIAAGSALAIAGVWAFSAASAQDKTKGEPALRSLKDKASYAIGQNIGKSLKSAALEVNADLLAKGLRDALEGKGKLGDAEVREVLTAYQKESAASAGAKNRKEGEDFLAANKKKKGIVTTKSGLQYRVLKEGQGDSPALKDRVEVDYRGTLLDGTEFDSSYKRGQPASFAVGEVIKGWTEALQLMKPGSKYQLFIPADLAYGDDQQHGSPIPPGSVLIFEVELRKVVK